MDFFNVRHFVRLQACFASTIKRVCPKSKRLCAIPKALNRESPRNSGWSVQIPEKTAYKKNVEKLAKMTRGKIEIYNKRCKINQEHRENADKSLKNETAICDNYHIRTDILGYFESLIRLSSAALSPHDKQNIIFLVLLVLWYSQKEKQSRPQTKRRRQEDKKLETHTNRRYAR
jgi:hypothetical protein